MNKIADEADRKLFYNEFISEDEIKDAIQELSKLTIERHIELIGNIEDFVSRCEMIISEFEDEKYKDLTGFLANTEAFKLYEQLAKNDFFRTNLGDEK